MGHLYYGELGNNGYIDTAGNQNSVWGLKNKGDFNYLNATLYWSGTQYAADTNLAWYIHFSPGEQDYSNKVSNYNAIAVRPGLAVVPEPLSSTLFIVGGGTIGFRRLRKKFKN